MIKSTLFLVVLCVTIGVTVQQQSEEPIKPQVELTQKLQAMLSAMQEKTETMCGCERSGKCPTSTSHLKRTLRSVEQPITTLIQTLKRLINKELEELLGENEKCVSEERELRCEKQEDVLHVIKAELSNLDNQTCAIKSAAEEPCLEIEKVMAKVIEMCDGKKECKLTMKDFDEICPCVARKYMKVTYRCGDAEIQRSNRNKRLIRTHFRIQPQQQRFDDNLRSRLGFGLLDYGGYGYGGYGGFGDYYGGYGFGDYYGGLYDYYGGFYGGGRRGYEEEDESRRRRNREEEDEDEKEEESRKSKKEEEGSKKSKKEESKEESKEEGKNKRKNRKNGEN